MQKEILRKLFHIFSILALLIPLELFGKYSITILMLLMILIFYPISSFKIKNRFTKPFWILLNFIERDENLKNFPAKQAFSLGLSLVIVSIFFDKRILEISIISLAVYDGIATIAGKLFGKIKLINNRTLEGTIAGIIANTIALNFILNPFTALLISIFTALIEIFSSGKALLKDDNFTIPVGVAFFSWILFSYLKGLGTAP